MIDDNANISNDADNGSRRGQDHADDTDNDEDYTSDQDYEDSDDDYDDGSDLGDNDDIVQFGIRRTELKQHCLAVLFAIVAAITTHAQVHGGFGAWKQELVRDLASKGWLRDTHQGDEESHSRSHSSLVPRAVPNDALQPRAPYAAPSMNAIPTPQRRQALQRTVATSGTTSITPVGHYSATSYQRTSGLYFCDIPLPIQELTPLEFVLPLEPTVRVLHSYYLADYFQTEEAWYHSPEPTDGSQGPNLGIYTHDAILQQIEKFVSDDNPPDQQTILTLLQSKLSLPPAKLREHSCLLHQYAVNLPSGRSIRGHTLVYDRPHVSSFYHSHQKIPPASLTFTGYASKFINLSPTPIHLYWEGKPNPGSTEITQTLVGTIPPMESLGTATFPGHAFYVTPLYDASHMLQRWTITEDEPILYYDPLDSLTEEQALRKLSYEQAFQRDAWKVDKSFARDYLVQTGRVWLSHFPHPIITPSNAPDSDLQQEHANDSEVVASSATPNEESTINESVIQPSIESKHMWDARYIGQTHTIRTSHLYFTKVPPLTTLAKEDYQQQWDLDNYRSAVLHKPKTTTNNKISNLDNSTMALTLKVVSCAPRVLEVKRFLSPVEVQHFISLFETIALEPSTVLASSILSNANGAHGSPKSVRGAVQANTRSSKGGWIHREENVIVDTVFRRIADVLNIDEMLMRDHRPDHLVGLGHMDHRDNKRVKEPLPTHDRIVEAMQLVRYGPGDEYTAHHDFTYPSISNRYQPKRFVTVLLYLNGEGDVVQDGKRIPASSASAIAPSTSKDPNVESLPLEGGHTTFPRAITTQYHDGVKITPQSGKAVIFYNVLPDGNMDDLSQHAGEKVEAGVKYLANIWVWDPIIN